MTDHLPALVALIYLPVVLVGLLLALDLGARLRMPAARRCLDLYEAAPRTTKLAALLLAMTGTVHLGLVTTHLDQPVTATLFAVDGLFLTGFSGLVFLRGTMRAAAVGLLAASLSGYALYLLVGLESLDAVGLATKLIEVSAAGLLLTQWATLTPKDLLSR